MTVLLFAPKQKCCINNRLSNHLVFSDATQPLHKNSFKLISCTKIKAVIISLKAKESGTSNDMGCFGFPTIRRFFGAKKFQRQLEGKHRTCSVGRQTSTALYNGAPPYPFIPPFESKIYHLPQNLWVCMYPVFQHPNRAALFKRGETKI